MKLKDNNKIDFNNLAKINEKTRKIILNNIVNSFTNEKQTKLLYDLSKNNGFFYKTYLKNNSTRIIKQFNEEINKEVNNEQNVMKYIIYKNKSKISTVQLRTYNRWYGEYCKKVNQYGM